MSRPFIMYNKDMAREGREYDHDYHDKAQLEREGWVDSVSKMGKLEWKVNDPYTPKEDDGQRED